MGKIVFSSNTGALNYAKNRCIDALKSKHPFERGIWIKDNVILKEIDGCKDSINLSSIPESITKGAIFVHGHPRGNPILSKNDILVMLAHKANCMMAICKDGKYTKFTRNHDGRMVDLYNEYGKPVGTTRMHNLKCYQLEAIYSDLIRQQAKCISSEFPAYDREFIENIIHLTVANHGDQYANPERVKLAKQFYKKFQENSKLEKRFLKISDILFKRQISIGDRFLQKIADKYGFTYSKNI